MEVQSFGSSFRPRTWTRMPAMWYFLMLMTGLNFAGRTVYGVRSRGLEGLDIVKDGISISMQSKNSSVYNKQDLRCNGSRKVTILKREKSCVGVNQVIVPEVVGKDGCCNLRSGFWLC